MVSFVDALHAADRALGPFHAVVAHSMGAAATLIAANGGLRAERLALVAPPDASKAPGRFVAHLGLPEAVTTGLISELERRYGLGIEAFAGPTVAATVAQPILLVHDVGDVFVPAADGAAIAAAAPRATLVTTRGLGHHRVLRDPDVVGTIRYFIERRPS